MNTYRSLLFGLIVAFALHSACAVGAETPFDGITCATNMTSALVGRHMPNERVVTMEARYKNIGLKDLGAFGMEDEGDPWTLISWNICGREYLLLERRGIVRDVLASPLPSGSPQSVISTCTRNGVNLDGTAVAFVAVNDNKWPKLVEHAWLIDDKTIKFEKIVGAEIACAP